MLLLNQSFTIQVVSTVFRSKHILLIYNIFHGQGIVVENPDDYNHNIMWPMTIMNSTNV